MSVTSWMDYWDKDLASGAGGWNSLGMHELVEVEYNDEVYKPATVTLTIQNTSASGGVPQLLKSHSSASPLVVTNTNHGLKTGSKITVTAETSGAIELKLYRVEKIDADSFYLQHYEYDILSGQKAQGGKFGRVNGDGSATPTLSYVPAGKYSVETPDIAKPTFSMGQEIILWNVPETFSKGGPYAYTGGDPIVVTHTSHPFSDDDIVQFIDDTQGVISPGAYKIGSSTTNTYQLVHIDSGEDVAGNGTAGQISTFFDTKSVGFPLVYGTISDLSENYNAQYGKTIVIKGVDLLHFLSSTTAKRLFLEVPTAPEYIGSAVPRMANTMPDLTYLTGAGSQDKFSSAIGQMIDDFSEGGKSIIYHDNTNNGSTAFDSDANKFQDSGFVLTADELASGNFEKDLSDTNFKLLRVMQQLAMADRHTTTDLSVTGASYGSTGSTTAVTITKTSAFVDLKENAIIAISGDNQRTGGVEHIPNGVYRAKDVTDNSFTLWTLTNKYVVQEEITGTVNIEGVEDGNFGYDFYLDSGIYGLPGQTGMSIAGAAEIPFRPHMNYFKRGYLQFRPDATGLNINLPLTVDGAEDGQNRIMYPDARFTVGDDEVVTAVELQASSGGTSGFRRDLGHTLEVVRVKGIACKDNVPYITQANDRQAFAGQWLGDFHWGRHDSFIARTGEQVLTKRNDIPMLYQSDASTSLGTDISGDWVKADTATGSPNDKLVAARVVITDAGGVSLSPTAIVSGTNAPSLTGYAGLSELSSYGRSLVTGPGEKGTITSVSGNETDVSSATTGVVSCDLIKSVKNIEDEQLLSTTDYGIDSISASLVNTTGDHLLQEGAWIKIITGTAVDADDPWMNYYRVVFDTASQSDDEFYLTRLPAEAYEGYEELGETIPTASDIYDGTYETFGAGDIATYKRVYNVFRGVARVQYQTFNSATDEAFTDNFLLTSDRIKKDSPYMGIEVNAVSNRVSGVSDDTSGLTAEPATMPDGSLYAGTGSYSLLQDTTNAVPVRFRQGDKISETRFLFRDNGGTPRHLFKNTQAVIVENLMEDKNRSKTEELKYSMEGNDKNEVRRTAAAMLSRSSRDIVRGNVRIVKYPYIKLTGQAQASTTSAGLRPEQNLLVYGGRPGMLVTKTDSLDGTFQAGVLAENISTSTLTGTLSGSDTWSLNDYYRAYIHLRAGHTVRVNDPRASIQANMIATKIVYREGPGISSANIEVIGLRDTATGFPVKPIGKIRAEGQRNNTEQPTSVFNLGKAQLKGITFSAG